MKTTTLLESARLVFVELDLPAEFLPEFTAVLLQFIPYISRKRRATLQRTQLVFFSSYENIIGCRRFLLLIWSF